jgi:serine phosphatase RsbU (regulator of sigma subunit)
MLYLLIEPDTWAVQVGNAGHLPPLLVSGGRCEPVATALGTPFGAGVFERRAVSLQLDIGDCLVGLTDGLVERRGQDIDDGIAMVQKSVRGEAWSAEQIVHRMVTAASAGERHDDDMTVLAVRRT